MPAPTSVQGYGFAIVHLQTTLAAAPGQNHIAVSVWNRSHDHPLPAQRSSLISGIELIALAADGCPATTGPQFTLLSLVDGGGIDVKSLFVPSSTGGRFGLDGYRENDLGGTGGLNVVWAEFSGPYDERCVTDAVAEKQRPRSRVSAQGSATNYNYLRGPLVATWSAPSIPAALGVNLRLQFIGGSDASYVTARYSFGV